jgi:hypothetical protein
MRASSHAKRQEEEHEVLLAVLTCATWPTDVQAACETVHR